MGKRSTCVAAEAGPAVYVYPNGGGFFVEVSPAVEGGTFNTQHDSLEAANGYAGGLRLVSGWSVVQGPPPKGGGL